jgi:ribonuclease HII
VAPPYAAYEGVWAEVRDSKLLKPEERSRLALEIQQAALTWGVGMVSAQEIDEVGIGWATRLAMQRAIEQLDPAPDFLLIDWVRLHNVNLPQTSLVKADQLIVSVAAASILAKVARDSRLMQLGEQYPDYGFERHKGYGTADHLAALETRGPCPEHRHSFAPISRHPGLFDDLVAPSAGSDEDEPHE